MFQRSMFFRLAASASILALTVALAGGQAAANPYAATAAPAYPGNYYAPPASQSGLGGGLIEALATGGDPAPAYAPPVAPSRAANAHVAAYDPGQAANVQREVDPIYFRAEVDYPTSEPPGSVVVDTPHKFLYYVRSRGRAIRYGIGVGRPGFEWSGVKSVSRKAEWPDWTPPAEMLSRRPDLPRHMDGGPANPLGARALYLGSSLYRIHGTNEPYTIGQNVSSGCIRMMNDDVVDLYDRVHIGARVVVR